MGKRVMISVMQPVGGWGETAGSRVVSFLLLVWSDPASRCWFWFWFFRSSEFSGYEAYGSDYDDDDDDKDDVGDKWWWQWWTDDVGGGEDGRLGGRVIGSYLINSRFPSLVSEQNNRGKER